MTEGVKLQNVELASQLKTGIKESEEIRNINLSFTASGTINIILKRNSINMTD